MTVNVAAKRNFLAQWIAEYYADLGLEVTGWPSVVPYYKWIYRPKNVTGRYKRGMDGTTSVAIPEPIPYFDFIAYSSSEGKDGRINSYTFHLYKKHQATLRELCVLTLKVCGEWDLSDDNYNIE